MRGRDVGEEVSATKGTQRGGRESERNSEKLHRVGMQKEPPAPREESPNLNCFIASCGE